jgi:hypothetical protein
MTSNLSEMAMKSCHPKVLKVKPPRDFSSLLEAFSFERWPRMDSRHIKRVNIVIED